MQVTSGTSTTLNLHSKYQTVQKNVQIEALKELAPNPRRLAANVSTKEDKAVPINLLLCVAQSSIKYGISPIRHEDRNGLELF